MESMTLVFVFASSLLAGFWLSLLAHELGHALIALAVTGKSVALRMGSSVSEPMFALGRFRFSISLRGFRYAETEYDRTGVSESRQILVALGGPLFSGIVFGITVWWLSVYEFRSVEWVASLGAFIANLRILVGALLPIRYRPYGPDGEEWLSDSLDIVELARRKRKR